MGVDELEVWSVGVDVGELLSCRGSAEPFGGPVGRAASIDFWFAAPVDVLAVVDALSDDGVSFIADGAVSYLIDDDGMYDWQRAEASRFGEVLGLLGAEAADTATVAITLYFDGFPRGGDLLFFPDRRTVSFTVEVNRKLLPGGSRFCDIGWYLRRLVPIFEPFGLSSVEASDLP